MERGAPTGRRARRPMDDAGTIAPRSGPAVDRATLESLATDLPRVWEAPSSEMRLKQRIVRRLIHEIIANTAEDPREIVLLIHWVGGRHSELRMPRPTAGDHRHRTGPDAEGVVRRMAGAWSDPDIAGSLNRLRLRTGAGNTWTASRVNLWGHGGSRAIRPVQRQAQLPAVRMLDDHVAMALVIPLQPHHCQRHPVEGMDRQGDGHPLRREVLTRCSVMWSWASSPRAARATPAARTPARACRVGRCRVTQRLKLSTFAPAPLRSGRDSFPIIRLSGVSDHVSVCWHESRHDSAGRPPRSCDGGRPSVRPTPVSAPAPGASGP